MKNDRMKTALENIARRGVPEMTNLMPQIAAQLKRKSPMTTLRTRPFVAVLIALFILLTLSGVAYALGKALGYIPGVGIVDQSVPLRVLADPVSQTRDGITVTVEQVVVDTTQITLLYKVDGLTDANFDTEGDNAQKCYSNAILRLSDEQLSPVSQNGKNGGTSYEVQASYPALPPSVKEVTFILPCIQFTSHGKAPENWELPMQLTTDSTNTTILPVIEIATPGPLATVTNQNIPANPDAISLILSSAVQMDDGYLLYVTVDWSNANIDFLDVPNPANIHLLDSKGQEMPFNLVYDDASAGVFTEKHQTIFAIKTAPIQVAGPLILTVDALPVETAAHGSFSFDPGTNPFPGQTWEINQDVDLGNGLSLRVLRATYTNLYANPGLLFDMESAAGVTQAWLTDALHPLFVPQGGGGSISYEPLPFTGEFFYEGNFPAETITVNISRVAANFHGSWQAQWTPPAPSLFVPPSRPEACVSKSKFEQALREKPVLPENLKGSLILYGPYRGNDSVWRTSIVNLDGTPPFDFGEGDGDFSPDGLKVVFSRYLDENAENGIFIMDLSTGETVLLPGTERYDFNPMWSPDGSQIVFNRGNNADLYVVNADGSNLRRLTYDPGQEFPIGWMPDGQHLLYALPGMAYQQTDYVVNVQTGEIEYFSTDEFLGMSPNTQFKITAERDASNMDAWVSYFAGMDDSNRWVLAESGIVLQYPIWSADGEWLLVSLSKLYDDKNVPVFIHLTDCQIIPIPNMKGIVVDWLQ